MMTKDRFNALTSALHFANNEGEHEVQNRLWKLCPVLDVLDTMYQTVFFPNKTVTIDKTLWAFKGQPEQASKVGHEGLQDLQSARSQGTPCQHEGHC